MTALHLVTSIGVARKYGEVTYRLNGKETRTRFAPVALARLHPRLAGARASVLVTRQAREVWYDEFAAELTAAGVVPEPVPIPDGVNEAELLEIFRALTERVDANDSVVLDVTFALRHLPFIYLAALTYLSGLRDVRIEGIYYGAYESGSPDGIAPILELTTLWRLIQWYYALRSMRETGDLTAVAESLDSDVGRLFRSGGGSTDLRKIAGAAEKLAASLGSGLPLEVGLNAALLRERIVGLMEAPPGSPAMRLAIDTLRNQLDDWVIEDPPTSLGAPGPSKGDVPLTTEELQRQLRVAEHYIGHGNVPRALRLLREWLVSLALLGRDDADRWLDRGRREAASGWLNGLQERAASRVATPAEKTLGTLWKRVAERRNRLAHGGMTADEAGVKRSDAIKLLEGCRLLLTGATLHNLPRPTNRRILITPLGRSPGVIYTGMRCLHPNELIVITSAEARKRLAEALAKSGHGEMRPRVIELSDPYRNFRETERHINAELRQQLVNAGEAVLNIAGGTTALQVAAEKMAGEARRLGVPVRRCAVVDRRTPDEQRRDPYVCGEIVWFDQPTEAEDGDTE